MRYQELLVKNLILFFAIAFISQNVSAQAPQDISAYLNRKDVSRGAKDFYNGKLKASDDEKTLSIVDSLNTKNNVTRPFYIYLVSKMAKHADGALSEELGIACKDFVEDHPNEAIEFLYSTNKMVEKEFVSYWAKQIAWEFGISCEHKEKDCLRKSFESTTKKTKSINKDRLNQFYNQVEVFIDKYM